MEFMVGPMGGFVVSFLCGGGAVCFVREKSTHQGSRKAGPFAAGVSLSDILIVVFLMLTVLSNLSFTISTPSCTMSYVSIIGSLATAVFRCPDLSQQGEIRCQCPTAV